MASLMLKRESAEVYASWFKALADPTRVQLVTLLANHGRPMSVGEIVATSGVGQSTVSHHLKTLAEVRFVLSEQDGTTRWYRINEACVSRFPSAADVVMGRQVPMPPDCRSDGSQPNRSDVVGAHRLGANVSARAKPTNEHDRSQP